MSDKPGFEGKNCIGDEHYLPTFFQIVDPGGIANWSTTHVDWSERKWHPKSYTARDVTYELLKNITSIDVSVHVSSDEKREVQSWPCLWNGIQKPCYLFARKFTPGTLDRLSTGITGQKEVKEDENGSLRDFGSSESLRYGDSPPPKKKEPVRKCRGGQGLCGFQCNDGCCNSKCAAKYKHGVGFCEIYGPYNIYLCVCNYVCSALNQGMF
ncbi:unnamed protein product [Sphenostylis stenocarpa]|uniref:Uncharacterized protein n=1 Tax=Sphenostylis stenocarpa TaxID=92480 RepID=A0AA86SZG5_9FABA|nr:unnamed protein product [Sphenostylis stenocarpa]